jgi:NAD-dependent dihydropyrimidine dehydrogenase PreA subunit
MAVRVDLSKCTGCGSCIGVCAWGALSLADDRIVVDDQRCGECGACVQSCANGALELVIEAIPVESAPCMVPPGIVELNARPVATPSSMPSEGRSSGGWLSVFGRTVGALASYFIDRALDGGNASVNTDKCLRRRHVGGMRRRRGR